MLILYVRRKRCSFQVTKRSISSAPIDALGAFFCKLITLPKSITRMVFRILSFDSLYEQGFCLSNV